MRYGQVKTEKLYFSSSEAAEQIGVPVSILHSWEKQHPELNPKRDRAGKRTYRPSDIEIAKRIASETEATQITEPCSEPPKTTKTRSTAKTASVAPAAANKDSILKIRDNLKNVLEKIRK